MRVKHADYPNQKMILLYPESEEERIQLKKFADNNLGEAKILYSTQELERLQVPVELLVEIFDNVIWHGIRF